MKPVLTVFFSFLICALCSSVARAEFTAKTAYDFMAAQKAVYKKGTPESVEQFLAYLTDDFKDIHVAYGVEFSGKEHLRENMPKKSKALISYESQVSQVIVGTNVAIIIFAVQAEEKKPDGRISNYDGGTVMVLDFNDDGLITQMKRYQD